MKLIIFIALCLCAASSFAQNTYSILGTATDSVSKAALPVTVTVLNAKDSVLRKFTYAASDGSFAMSGLPQGRFFLLVTYPDYADYSTVFTLGPADREHSFGNIKMAHGALMLKEVNIKDDAPAIKIKGDTIEFNAKKYVIQPNDKVEDLLKQLPGITIDKDGHIKSGGETISKVLLDGEEFFGDDPTLITRNIRGDMVDKIQLYDKKSDQATFTGVDDGKKQRVINVQLKQDKRTGVFGKVLGGAGNDGYYEGQGFVNKFTTQYKAAAYGTISNDGKVGLGAADNGRLGMNNLMVIMAGSATTVASAGNSPLDRESYGGRGLPETKTGGVHYDSKWNKNTESINANYKIGNLSSTTDENDITQTSFPTSTQNTVDNSHRVNNLFRQKIDALYTNTSATSNLRVDMNGTLLHTHDYSTDASTSTQADTLLNRYNKVSDVKTDEKTFNTNIFFSKRLKKQGSGISLNLQEAYDQSQSTNYLNYDPYTAYNSKDSITNQYKPTNNSGLALASRITYNQLIFKKVSMVLNYEATINNSTSDQKSYNQSSPGVYNLLDNTNSSNYKLNQFNNQMGIALNYNTPKTNFNVGTGANDVSFKQTNLNTDYVYKRNYINWSPRANFTYRVGTSKSLQLGYSGSSMQPSISQVQPVANNLNPLYTTIGNPDLKPTFSNYINGSYNSFQQLTGQSFNVRGSATFVNNNIINKQTRNDATGKIINQYVNLNGKTTYGFNLDVAYSKKITALDMQATIDAYTNQSRGYLYSNTVLVKTSGGYTETEFTLRKDKLKKYTLSLSVVPNVNTYDNSPVIQPNYVSFNWNIRSSAVVYLPAKFQIGSNLSDRIRGKLPNQPGTVNTDWDATISKTFLKTDELKLLLTCNNILNQEGFYRNSSSNSITQQTYNTIRRYFMLSISWDFAHFPTIPVK